MTLLEAIKTGQPHRRKNDNYVYFVPHVGGIGYSQADVLAEDWELATKPKLDLSNVLPIKKTRKKRKKNET
jgi:hypothetical protein